MTVTSTISDDEDGLPLTPNSKRSGRAYNIFNVSRAESPVPSSYTENKQSGISNPSPFNLPPPTPPPKDYLP